MQEMYYLTIDECPFKSWRLANNGELKSLRKGKEGNEETDKEAFELLFNDFIEKIGLSDDYKKYLELINERFNLQYEFMTKYKTEGYRDRFLLNRLKILDAEIEKIETKEYKGLSITQIMALISKMQGYHIRENDITVLEYFECIKMLK